MAIRSSSKPTRCSLTAADDTWLATPICAATAATTSGCE
jgi:hypothetical protein